MVLVTGASGFLGGELVKQLVAMGEPVRIIKRSNAQLSHLSTIIQQIEVVEADILDIPSLELAMDGIEKIYHSAAVIGYDSSYYKEMYKTNIEGTANVVNVALSKKVKKILHVSSIAAIGGKPNELITEDTKWEKNKWNTHYGITKMLAEREIYRGISEGLEAVIVNPGIILGVGHKDKSTMRIFRNIQQQKLPFYTHGINGFVDVHDVVNCCIQLMNSDANTERYILVAENRSFKDYFELIASSLHVKAPTFQLNNSIGQFFLLVDWLASKITNRKRGLTSENMKIAIEKFEYSNQKVMNQLGYQFVSLEDTIKKIASQMKDV